MYNYKKYIVPALVVFTVLINASSTIAFSRLPSGDPIPGDLISVDTTASEDFPLRLGTRLIEFYNRCGSNGFLAYYMTLLNTENGSLTQFLTRPMSGTRPVSRWVSNEFFPGVFPENATWTFTDVPSGNYTVAAECRATFPDPSNNPHSFDSNPSDGFLFEGGQRTGLSSYITGTGTFTVVNVPLPIITTPILAEATVGAFYSQTLSASGGTEPFDWSIFSNNLPTGLFLNRLTGEISGTPTIVEAVNFTVQVEDDNNKTDIKLLTITVNPLPNITTVSIPDGRVGTTYRESLHASGGTPEFNWTIESGSLPGLSLSSTGVLSGTPATAGVFTIVIQAEDSYSVVAFKQFDVNINPAPTGDLISVDTTASEDFPLRLGTRLIEFYNRCGSDGFISYYITLLNTEDGSLTQFLTRPLSGTRPVSRWVSNEFFPGVFPENATWTFTDVPSGNYTVAAECRATFPDPSNNPHSFDSNPSDGFLFEGGQRTGYSSHIKGRGTFTVVGNTPAGSPIIVGPLNDVTITFTEVTQEGHTTVASSSSGTQPPSGFKLGAPPVYYNISTTAVYVAPVEVCINYDETQFNNENNLKLSHFEDGAWINVTTSLDTTNNILCGEVSSFSEFAILEDLDIDYLISEVQSLNLEDGIEQGLLAKLNSAKSALERNKEKTAKNILKAFINQVKAQKGKAITNEQADILIRDAETLRDQLRSNTIVTFLKVIFVDWWMNLFAMIFPS